MKKRYIIVSVVIVLGILCLLTGFIKKKNALTEGAWMDHSNYASFGPGDKVTFGSDFLGSKKELAGHLECGFFFDDELIAATYVLKNYERDNSGVPAYDETEGYVYERITGVLYVPSQKEIDIVFPLADQVHGVIQKNHPEVHVPAGEELKESIHYGIKIYSPKDAEIFIKLGMVITILGVAVMAVMLLRRRFTGVQTALILTACIPLAIALLWILYSDELGEFTIHRLYLALRGLYITSIGMEATFQIMAVLLGVAVLLLMIAHIFLKKDHLKLWMVMCGIPLVAYLLSWIKIYVITEDKCTNDRYFAFGVIAFLILLWGILTTITKHYKLCTFYLLMLSLILYTWNVIYVGTTIYKHQITNHTHEGWEESFEGILDDLSQMYTLRDWKEIDFDALKDEYLPRVREAEEHQDKVAMMLALYDLKYELADGHVWVRTTDTDVQYEALDRLAGNDYGLSMFSDEDGEFVAVCVDPDSEAAGAGITDGTVITKWGGEPAAKAAADVKCVYWESFAYTELEDVFRPVFLAGKGSDTIEVSFLDENNVEQTVCLETRGSYRGRLEDMISRIYREEDWQKAENYSTAMLNDQIGYLRITEEHHRDDSTLYMVVSYIDGYSEKLYNELNEKLKALKEQGMDCLVIDLRSNAGGFQMFARSIIGLFTDQPQAIGSGVYRDHEYHIDEGYTVYGHGDWKDLPVVCLINGDTISCGDITAYNLQQVCGAVLAGSMPGAGSAQGVGTTCYMTDGEFTMGFSTFLTPDPDGLPMIDAKADRKARYMPDLKLSFSREEVVEFFREDGRDVELDKVIEYIESQP